MYDGAEGSYCWPDHVADDGSVVGICADKIAWAGLEGAIPLEVGSTVTIVIESEEPAQELFVGFYEIDSNTQVNSMNLGPGSEVSFSADLAEGVYNVSVFGGWPDGDISYEFRIEVLPEP